MRTYVTNTSDLTLEQVMMEHSGASQEVFNQAIYDWLKDHNQTDKQLGFEDHKPNLPKCCQRCPNNKNAFCNCAMPSMEMITY
jgi:hypothetical protein